MVVGVAFYIAAPSPIERIWFEMVHIVVVAIFYGFKPAYVQSSLTLEPAKENDKFKYRAAILAAVINVVYSTVSASLRLFGVL